MLWTPSGLDARQIPGLPHSHPEDYGLPASPELHSLSQPENEDWYLHLTLLLGGAKLLVCVVPGGRTMTGAVPQGVLGLAGEGPAPSCVWVHVRVHFRIPGV